MKQPHSKSCRHGDCFSCPYPDCIANAKACERSVTHPAPAPKQQRQLSPWGYIQPDKRAARHINMWLYEMRGYLREHPNWVKGKRDKMEAER